MAANSLQAQVLRELGTGCTVGEAFDKAGVSPGADLCAYNSLIQMVNGLDMLRVLVPRETGISSSWMTRKPLRSNRTRQLQVVEMESMGANCATRGISIVKSTIRQTPDSSAGGLISSPSSST